MRANRDARRTAVRGFRAEIRRSAQYGDTAWSEWRWSGTRSDGQAFEMRGVTLFEISDGQIVAGRLYMEDVERDVTGSEQAVEDLSGRGRGRRSSRAAQRPQPPIECLSTRTHPPSP